MRNYIKYSNRKLYCLESSRYVKLTDVAETVKGGANVRIVDHKTKNDITDSILPRVYAQVVRNMPRDIVEKLIRGVAND